MILPLFYLKIRPEVHSSVRTQRHVTNQPASRPMPGRAAIGRVNPAGPCQSYLLPWCSPTHLPSTAPYRPIPVQPNAASTRLPRDPATQMPSATRTHCSVEGNPPPPPIKAGINNRAGILRCFDVIMFKIIMTKLMEEKDVLDEN